MWAWGEGYITPLLKGKVQFSPPASIFSLKQPDFRLFSGKKFFKDFFGNFFCFILPSPLLQPKVLSESPLPTHFYPPPVTNHRALV